MHVRAAGSFSEQFALLFRDYLRAHAERADENAKPSGYSPPASYPPRRDTDIAAAATKLLAEVSTTLASIKARRRLRVLDQFELQSSWSAGSRASTNVSHPCQRMIGSIASAPTDRVSPPPADCRVRADPDQQGQ